jgi:hypothetical protein
VPVYARGRSRLRLRADPAAAGGGYDDLMGPVATRLRLPVQAQEAVLAVSVALFQLLGTYRATGNQPGARPLGDPDGDRCVESSSPQAWRPRGVEWRRMVRFARLM